MQPHTLVLKMQKQLIARQSWPSSNDRGVFEIRFSRVYTDCMGYVVLTLQNELVLKTCINETNELVSEVEREI